MKKIEDRLKKLIDDKAADLNGENDLPEYVAYKIKILNEFIDQTRILPEQQIDDILSELVGFFTTSLRVPVPVGTKISRARAFKTKYNECDVSNLSYIPYRMKELAKIGRLNKQKEPVYYGCIYFNDREGVNVALSEVDVEIADNVNILRSSVTTDIDLYYVGIFDHVHRQCKPRFFEQEMFDYFTTVYNYQEMVFDEGAFLAHVLCDSFLSDILRRKGSDKLYAVTSQLFDIFCEDENTDGILYTSVKSEGDPVVALKTSTVDAKLHHDCCDSYMVLADFGYAKYRAVHNSNGLIDASNRIQWK